MKVLLDSLFLAFILTAHSASLQTVLPCYVTGIEPAGDGSGVWFTCSCGLAALKQAADAGEKLPPYTGLNNDPTELYWLPSATNIPLKIASARVVIKVLPAPSSSHALIVMPQNSGCGQVVLYNREHQEEELPVNACFLLWSTDEHRLYFYGGATIQADAWNILGMYELNTGETKRLRLHEPTEIVDVCPATGNVYSTTPSYPGFSGSTVEYTPTMEFRRKIYGWIGAQFSARCTYVASESSYHGPLPWSIYEVKASKRMFQFPAMDDENEPGAYVLVEWNPKYDPILLRKYIPTGKTHAVLEVFDVRSGRVLQSMRETGPSAWSADGKELIVAERNTIGWVPVALPTD